MATLAGLSTYYRLRWIVEEYFLTLKTAGFNIEEADIGDPLVMINVRLRYRGSCRYGDAARQST